MSNYLAKLVVNLYLILFSKTNSRLRCSSAFLSALCPVPRRGRHFAAELVTPSTTLSGSTTCTSCEIRQQYHFFITFARSTIRGLATKLTSPNTTCWWRPSQKKGNQLSRSGH